METPLAPGFYLHLQDFVDALIGPFETPNKALDYFAETVARGDSAAFMAVYSEAAPGIGAVAEYAHLMTIKEDKEFDSSGESGNLVKISGTRFSK